MQQVRWWFAVVAVGAADDALRFFFTHCQSKATGLLAWGEHLGWDFHTEAVRCTS